MKERRTPLPHLSKRNILIHELIIVQYRISELRPATKSVMDEGAHGAGQRLGTSETASRKESLSEKLNKLTNDTFGRRRTSGFNASSESLSSRPRRSYIPTPSLGSRASSLLSGLGLDTRDRTDSRATQRVNRKDTSRASTSKYSRHVSGSSSSFFESNDLRPLYPRDFLDKLDTGVERKENSRPTENAQTDCPHPQPPSSPNFTTGVTEHSNFNSSTGAVAKLDGGSDISTQSTIKKSRRISDRLARTSFFKQYSARHSIAAVPLTPSTKAKAIESTVKIAERRLMAPIDPPLPRSTTMGPLNGPSAHSRQHSSPRTPGFMRPTSSSAARRSTISNTYKSSPTPLTLASGQRTADMSGFLMNRERKRAAHEAATTLGSHRISYESTPGFLPGNGPQIMARNGLNAVQERRKLLHPHWHVIGLTVSSDGVWRTRALGYEKSTIPTSKDTRSNNIRRSRLQLPRPSRRGNEPSALPAWPPLRIYSGERCSLCRSRSTAVCSSIAQAACRRRDINWKRRPKPWTPSLCYSGLPHSAKHLKCRRRAI